MKQLAALTALGVALLVGCSNEEGASGESAEPEPTESSLSLSDACPRVQDALDASYSDSLGIYDDEDHEAFIAAIEPLASDVEPGAQAAFDSLVSASEASMGTAAGGEALAAERALIEAINLVGEKCEDAGAPLD